MILHFLFMASKLRSVGLGFFFWGHHEEQEVKKHCLPYGRFLRGDGLVNLIMTPRVTGMQINHLLNVGILDMAHLRLPPQKWLSYGIIRFQYEIWLLKSIIRFHIEVKIWNPYWGQNNQISIWNLIILTPKWNSCYRFLILEK